MNPKTIIVLIAMSLLLFGSGCIDRGNDEIAAPQYTDPYPPLGEAQDESVNINSTVDLSLGENLTATGKAWQYNVTNVEIEVINMGEESVFIAYAVATFDNGICGIRSWDDGDRIIEPGEKESFYMGSDSGCQNLFENSSVDFRFNLVTATDEGQNQTTIYKGKALIPELAKGESCAFNIARLTE